MGLRSWGEFSAKEQVGGHWREGNINLGLHEVT